MILNQKWVDLQSRASTEKYPEGATEKARLKNSIIKPLPTLSVLCTKNNPLLSRLPTPMLLQSIKSP